MLYRQSCSRNDPSGRWRSQPCSNLRRICTRLGRVILMLQIIISSAPAGSDAECHVVVHPSDGFVFERERALLIVGFGRTCSIGAGDQARLVLICALNKAYIRTILSLLCSPLYLTVKISLESFSSFSNCEIMCRISLILRRGGLTMSWSVPQHMMTDEVR